MAFSHRRANCAASPTNVTLTAPMLTVDDVAAQLNVCDRTVRRWITTKQLRVHRFGRSIRISTADFQCFLSGAPVNGRSRPKMSAQILNVWGVRDHGGRVPLNAIHESLSLLTAPDHRGHMESNNVHECRKLGVRQP